MSIIGRRAGRVQRPKKFLRTGRAPGVRSVLVCAGDSLTHGLANANFVKPLQRRLTGDGVQVVNAGWSGDLAVNLLRRVDDIVACRPDVVTVLIGTNDVAARIDEKWLKGYRRKELTEPPSADSYRRSLERIVERLQQQTSASIALLEIPMVGENLDSVHNQRVDAYNEIIHETADAHGIRVLPLHQRLVDLLPAGHRPTPFDGAKGAMGRAAVKHFLLRRSWDRISADNGLALLTDHIHLNDRGARVISDLVEEFVRSQG